MHPTPLIHFKTWLQLPHLHRVRMRAWWGRGAPPRCSASLPSTMYSHLLFRPLSNLNSDSIRRIAAPSMSPSPPSFARSAVLHSTERTNYRKSLKDARSRYPPMLESSVDSFLSLANQFSSTLSPFDSAAQTNRNLFQLLLSDFNLLSGRRVQFCLDKTIE